MIQKKRGADFDSEDSALRISGRYDPKHILFHEKNLGKQIFWEINGKWISVYDTETLRKQMFLSAKHRDWETARLTNGILREVELWRQDCEVHYYPSRLQIEHSGVCNARCIMCSHSYTNNFGRRFLNWDVISALEPIFPYVEQILLHGIGEPFLNPNIREFLELYAKYSIRVSCVTNLTVMDEELAQLIGKTFRSLTISCDGAKRETFERIRRGTSFLQVCENIRLLKKICPALELRFNVVCMRQNLREIPDIIDLAQELGVSAVGISGLMAQKVLGNSQDEIEHYPKTAAYYLQETVRRAKQKGVRLLQLPVGFNDDHPVPSADEITKMNGFPFRQSDSFFQNLHEQYRRMNSQKPIVRADTVEYAVPGPCGCDGICDYFTENPYIDINGDMTSCCIDGIHIMGNVLREPFAKIWNCPSYRRMRELFYGGHLPRYCTGCMLLKDRTKTDRICVNVTNRDFQRHPFSDYIDSIMDE